MAENRVIVCIQDDKTQNENNKTEPSTHKILIAIEDQILMANE